MKKGNGMGHSNTKVVIGDGGFAGLNAPVEWAGAKHCGNGEPGGAR